MRVLFTLRVQVPDEIDPHTMAEILDVAEQHDEGTAAAIGRWLGDKTSGAEDAMNDTLPEGFYCKIEESGEGVDLAAVRRLEEMGR